MLILAFDTATAATAVALAEVTPPGCASAQDDKPAADHAPIRARAERRLGTLPASALSVELRDDPERGKRPAHARRLLGLIHEALERAERSWDQVDRIAVGTGPGTFTGMRIGIASAQALAQSTGIPLVGVSTLRSLELGARSALASGAPTAHSRPCHTRGSSAVADLPRNVSVLAVIDARRGEAFAAGAELEPSVLDPTALAAVVRRISRGQGGSAASASASTSAASASTSASTSAASASTRLVAVGDGAIAFRELLSDAGAEVPPDDSPLHLLSARNHCLLAAAAPVSRTGLIEPRYLRAPDAVPSARR